MGAPPTGCRENESSPEPAGPLSGDAVRTIALNPDVLGFSVAPIVAALPSTVRHVNSSASLLPNAPAVNEQMTSRILAEGATGHAQIDVGEEVGAASARDRILGRRGRERPVRRSQRDHEHAHRDDPTGARKDGLHHLDEST